MKTKRCRCFRPRKITKLTNNNFPKVKLRNPRPEKTKEVSTNEAQSLRVGDKDTRMTVGDIIKGEKVAVVQEIEVNVNGTDDPVPVLNPEREIDIVDIEIINGNLEAIKTGTATIIATNITMTHEVENFNHWA